MTLETIQLLEQELRATYPSAVTALDGGRRLVSLPEVDFPKGCRPSMGGALVVLDPNAAKPEMYLSQVPVLPSGGSVSVGTVSIGGQAWQTFSFNVAWEEGKHNAIQYVEAKLARLRREA